MAGLVTKARLPKGELVGYRYGILGYTLPALPEWAAGRYACALRVEIYSNLCHLYVFEDYTIGKVEIVTALYSWSVATVGHAKRYVFDPDGDSDVWELESETDGSDPYKPAVGNLGWANFEVRKEDGSIKEITTDPVPVYA